MRRSSRLGAFGVALTRRSWPLWLLAFALTVIALWVAYFFRDPQRQGERGDRLVIAPADGKVVMITEVDEPTFMKSRAVRISIFMNVFNVHVNRYPVSGIVRLVERKPGRFLNAATEESSLENEQSSIGLETGSNHILVRQIAGLIARRIITDAKEGDRVQQGDRMGLIRFGSRVDVFLPLSATVRVKVGDITFAGVTVHRGPGRPMNALQRGIRPPKDRQGVRRAVVLMPNGLTLFNLFCGIYAIILAIRGDFADGAGIHRARRHRRHARRPRRARDGNREPIRRGARLARRRDLVRLRAGADRVPRHA